MLPINGPALVVLFAALAANGPRLVGIPEPDAGTMIPANPDAKAPAGPPLAPDPKCDAHLAAWEKTMSGVRNFHTRFELTRTGSIWKLEDKYAGAVLVMKPHFARLRIENAANNADYEAYIRNEKSLTVYSGLSKRIEEVRFGRTENKNADDPADELNPHIPLVGWQFRNVLNMPVLMGDEAISHFLFRMKADDDKKRFRISLVKEDPFYVYLDIKPVNHKDRENFIQARFALYGPNAKTPYLPAHVWLLRPDGASEIWKFQQPRTDVTGITEAAFATEELPGWSHVRKSLPERKP